MKLQVDVGLGYSQQAKISLVVADKTSDFYGKGTPFLPLVYKGTHGQAELILRPAALLFAPRTSSTRRSSALQGTKLASA